MHASYAAYFPYLFYLGFPEPPPAGLLLKAEPSWRRRSFTQATRWRCPTGWVPVDCILQRDAIHMRAYCDTLWRRHWCQHNPSTLKIYPP